MPVHHISQAKAVGPRDFLSNPSNLSYYSLAGSTYTGSEVTAGPYGRSGDINTATGLDKIDILSGYYSKAYGNAQNLKAYSSRASSSRQNGASDFTRECTSELTAFHTNSRGFKTTFDQLSAGKGLAFYDRHSSIETLLKGIIDLHKAILSYTTEILDCDPELGPIFGPIIYDIKCILDEFLDATENITDALLNAYLPVITELSGEYGQVACLSVRC
ncbi:hypothetical protein BJV78DRAFT_1115668 [Lactifluus subvellereus]|nr:hypothetical protein BJV78DRAFT_1115668 [Lactifluus subvellereus]